VPTVYVSMQLCVCGCGPGHVHVFVFARPTMPCISLIIIQLNMNWCVHELLMTPGQFNELVMTPGQFNELVMTAGQFSVSMCVYICISPYLS